jgi:hypothetical protein
MARKAPETVRIRVLTSFNGMHRGDEADVVMSPVVQGWLSVGLIKVVGGGKDPAGPGGTEQDDHRSVPAGARGSRPASGEPGEGFGTGGYGTAESVDQG